MYQGLLVARHSGRCRRCVSLPADTEAGVRRSVSCQRVGERERGSRISPVLLSEGRPFTLSATVIHFFSQQHHQALYAHPLVSHIKASTMTRAGDPECVHLSLPSHCTLTASTVEGTGCQSTWTADATKEEEEEQVISNMKLAFAAPAPKGCLSVRRRDRVPRLRERLVPLRTGHAVNVRSVSVNPASR